VEWLKHLTETGAAKDIDLFVWTNCTTSNRAIFDVMRRFKSAHLRLSLDGHGPVYDYIRWPGKWSMVQRNMEYIAPIRDKFYITLNCVFQAYNAENVTTLCDWARDNNVFVFINPVYGPEWLDIRVLSPEKQKEIRSGLRDYAESIGSRPVDASIKEAITEVLARTAVPFDEEKHRSHLDLFVKMTNDLDIQRKQSLATSIPSVFRDVARMYGGEWPLVTLYTPTA